MPPFEALYDRDVDPLFVGKKLEIGGF